MSAHTHTHDDTHLHKIQQVIKWVVYSLLIVNFGFYIIEDWSRALHTIDSESTIFDITSEFANSIDLTAWFILLFMLELETYVLEDEAWKGWVSHTVRGVRLVCFVMIAHTVVAYTNTVIQYQPTVPIENASSLCDLVHSEYSYAYNLVYYEIDDDSCQSLTDATEFYRVGEDPLVSSLEGLQLERNLAWVDLVEAIAWLVILLLIELIVRMQGNGITGGPLMVSARRLKYGMYAVLILIAAYWATLSHWLYVWDEFLWIAGFAAIEMNIAEWRSELVEEEA